LRDLVENDSFLGESAWEDRNRFSGAKFKTRKFP
jgi:hypothetical protein